MTLPRAAASTTEASDDRYVGLDIWADRDILEALLDGQERAIAAVRPAIAALSAAARLAADRLGAGGRLVYLGAGSPALIALADALEIPGTYGIARDRILLLFAGGHAITENLTGADEDNGPLAARDTAAARIGPDDCVIAVSASGSTPYTVAGLAAAKAAGAATIAMAGNAGAPLFQAADIAVLLETGAEVISGSTRLAAGTALKAALNLVSTLIGVRLGHVHDGLMVNVVADNLKLRRRAGRIVAQIAGVAEAEAEAALALSGGVVKPAILIAAGADGLAAAEALLEASAGNVRLALAQLGQV